MENKIDNKIDQLLKQVNKDALLEKPSHDFTAKIMKRVHETPALTPTVQYTPLISKKTGIIIALLIVGCLGYVWLNNPSDLGWLPKVAFDKISIPSFFEQFKQLNISKTMIYALSFLGGMLLIQITWLKINHDKKWHN